tara:strand:- start:1667 stop:2140 length:474 start_codon:yes stop_codon:yes gene_type:complete
MNDQAQMAAVLLAGFFSTNEVAVQGDGLAGAVLTPRVKPEIVEISDGTCALVAAHRPAADVAYVPGVSVDGRSVVSASADSGFQYNLRPIYEFDVRLKPLASSGQAGSVLGDLTELNVAAVTYEPETGRVLVDGQEVIWMHENALKAACRSQITIEP